MHAVDDILIFVRVVDRRGLSAAGRELRLSTAVVSSRLFKLEERLGVRLLIRTTRSVSPTEEGRVYYEHCLRMLALGEDLEQSLAELKRQPAGSLRVSAAIGMGRKVVAPMVPQFVAENPGIQLRVQLTDRVVDLLGEDVDIAIRKGVLPSSSLIARRLAPDLRVVCGAPAYFERHGVPATPQDLKAHNCLLLRFPGSRRYMWQFDGMPPGASKMKVAGDLDSDSSDVLIDWAVAGRGLIMKSVWDIADEIASGVLVGVLPEYWPHGLSVHAVMPPRREQPAKTRSFLKFISERLRDHPITRLTARETIPLARPRRPAPTQRAAARSKARAGASRSKSLRPAT